MNVGWQYALPYWLSGYRVDGGGLLTGAGTARRPRYGLTPGGRGVPAQAAHLAALYGCAPKALSAL